MNFKRILITGGAGTLGRNLTEFFLKKNIKVCIIDNYETSQKVIKKDKNLFLFEGTITNKEYLKNIFEEFNPEIVINSAASYKDPTNFFEDVNTNIIGAINISELCLKYKVSKVINFQTALCYEEKVKSPIKETSPLNPTTSYSISKTAGESYLLNTLENVISLRIANVCSPYLSIGPIPNFYKRLKNNQKCFCTEAIRDFLDINDFLNLISLIIDNHKINGVYNASTGKGNSILEIYKHISKYLNLEEKDFEIKKIGNDDVKEVILDPSKAQRDFHWKANTSLETMLNKQLNWYDRKGINEIYSHLKNK